ncbi:MAG: hypothetical protein M1536_01860 [Firmicutes bacterium]|nr:hypothetical protein [Bacillota bacterium]
MLRFIGHLLLVLILAAFFYLSVTFITVIFYEIFGKSTQNLSDMYWQVMGILSIAASVYLSFPILRWVDRRIEETEDGEE